MTTLKIPARRRGVIACLLALLLPIGGVACSGQNPAGVNYESLVAASRAAYAELASEADALAASGRVDAGAVAAAEAGARVALAALSAPLATAPLVRRDARAPLVTGDARALTAIDLARLQGIAGDVRLALQTLAAIIPAGVLPAPVSAALKLAVALLDAFAGLAPAEARMSVVSAQAHVLAMRGGAP